MIAFSQAAQRNLILINAGASIALLTFMGNLLTKGESVAGFVLALACFAAGVAVGTLTSALAYLAQYLYSYPGTKWEKIGTWLHGVAIFTGFGTLAIFVAGSAVAYHAFGNQHAEVSSAREVLLPPEGAPGSVVVD